MTDPCRVSIELEAMKQIAPLHKVKHACSHDAVRAVDDDYVEDVILALKNMSATERHKLHSAFLAARATEHFDLIKIPVNAMRAKRMGTI